MDNLQRKELVYSNSQAVFRLAEDIHAVHHQLEALPAWDRHTKTVVRNRASQETDRTKRRRAEWGAAKETLENVVMLVWPKSGWQPVVFPDASDLYWGCFPSRSRPRTLAAALPWKKCA